MGCGCKKKKPKVVLTPKTNNQTVSKPKSGTPKK